MIVLSKTNVPAFRQGSYHYHIASISGIKIPSDGANQAWDFSEMKGGPLKNTVLKSAPSFSVSAVVDTAGTETISGNYGINSGIVYDTDTSGLILSGGMIPKQTFSLYSVTFNVKDSLYIPAQAFHIHRNLIKFPSSYQTTWTTYSRHSLNFKIRAAAYFPGLMPASKVVNTIVYDSVAGWGTLQIPSANRGSLPYRVLMVKRKTVTVDSFYLGGLPAPALLLSGFGVKQSDIAKQYDEFFYREGSAMALMSLDFGNDSTYSNTIDASYNADNVESGIDASLSSTAEFIIFPNPASEYIRINPAYNSDKVISITITNSIGQKIKDISFSELGANNWNIDVHDLKPGIFLVNFKGRNGVVTGSSRFTIIR
jgi:hypothetical protein